LYVKGIILAGLVVVHELHIQTPQFRQWLGRRKTANFPLQTKQLVFSLNDNIFGGALAMADSRASFSDEKEKALRYFAAVVGFVATPRWFVLMVVIHKLVAAL
jgi:hypothetical protein